MLFGACSSISASAHLFVRNVPLRLMSTTRSHSDASIECTGPPPATPAAFIEHVDATVLGVHRRERVGDRSFVAHVERHDPRRRG